MAAKTTTKKKKPKCTKGTACGYSCIAAGKVCNQPVPKDVAEDSLSAIPAKGKKKSEPKAADVAKGESNILTPKELTRVVLSNPNSPAINNLHGVVAKQLKLSKKDLDLVDPYVRDDDDEGVQEVKKLAEKLGVDPETALAIGQATRAWLGWKYRNLSPLTYRNTKDLDGAVDDYGDPHLTDGNITIMAGVVAGLKVMPKVTLDDPNLTQDGVRRTAYDKWDKQTVNRWVNLPNEVTTGFLEKYKEGEVISEDGMFGTTILSAKEMTAFSDGANITYEIKPKLDGTGKGHYVDHLKRSAHEGEILYEPGSKFKVAKIEKGEVVEDPGVKYPRPSIGLDDDGLPLDLNEANYKEKIKEIKSYQKVYKDSIDESGIDGETVAYGSDEDGKTYKYKSEKEVLAAIKKGQMVSMRAYAKLSAKPRITRLTAKIYLEEV